jgi:hypothetical protein
LNQAYIAYCFHSVPGYCKVFSFTGNGNTDGPFITLDFNPAAVLWKNADDAAANWRIQDIARNLSNDGTQITSILNGADAESSSGHGFDINSNGLKVRTAGGSDLNDNNELHVGIAWADYPFKESRAR